MKIGVLPGTFDPIHNGHLSLAEAVLQQLSLDEVWLLIDAEPYGKIGVTEFAHRLAMARAAADHPQIVADREPIQRRAERRTHKTATELKNTYPGAEFTLIMGADSFTGVHQWERVEEIANLFGFAVAPHRNIDADKIHRAGRHLNLNTTVIVLPEISTSSSKIRGDLSGSLQRGDIPQKVYDYIESNRLYGL